MTMNKSRLPRTLQIDTTFEEHYNIADLSKKWKLSRETVRQLVKNDPDVVKVRNGRRKAMTRYSIPASAATRIHTRLLNPPDAAL
jgi:hypothetical protein